MTLKEYDNDLIKIFGINTFLTIYSLPNVFRVNFEGSTLKQIYLEANDLVEKLFNNNTFLVRITFWNKEDKERYLSNSILIEEKKDYCVGVFKFKLSDSKFKELLKEHLNYELAEEPSINITAFIFDFNKKVLLNIYDDRGADYLII